MTISEVLYNLAFLNYVLLKICNMHPLHFILWFFLFPPRVIVGVEGFFIWYLQWFAHNPIYFSNFLLVSALLIETGFSYIFFYLLMSYRNAEYTYVIVSFFIWLYRQWSNFRMNKFYLIGFSILLYIFIKMMTDKNFLQTAERFLDEL
ncbi:ORF3 [nege-like virus 1]|nr:ORF3 [nege-like virus 1]